MDDEEQAAVYAKADFSSSNQMFVDGLIDEYSLHLNQILDIGCGPADIPIRIARKLPSIKITAVDASAPMVRHAKRAIENGGFKDQITVIEGCIPGLILKNEEFDAIISKDLLHHLPDPMIFWEEIISLAKKETVIYVMDLFRPETTDEARNIVESVSGNEPEILKMDFFNSLLAAFTVDEIKDQVNKAEMNLEVEKVSKRHLLIKGAIK